MKQRDYFNYTRRIIFLLSLLITLGGTTSAWADEYTIYEDADYTSDYVPFDGYNADAPQHNQMIIPSTVLTSLEGKKITSMTFYYTKNETSGTNIGNWIVSLGETEATSLSALDSTTPLTQVFSAAITPDTELKTITISFDEAYIYNGGNLLVDFNHPTASGYKKFTFRCANITPAPAYIRGYQRYYLPKTTFTYEDAVIEGAALVVKDGASKITSPHSLNFGLAVAGTSKTFTLSNPGTVDVEGLSVTETGNFNATLSATSIAAGGEATLTITMPSTSESSEITISSTSEVIDDFVFNVSGTVRDANKLYESGFTSLPEDWTTTGTWYYNATNGAYTTAWYLSSNTRLITPKLTIAEGEKFFVEAKGYSTSNTSYQHLQMQYSADGTQWTNFGEEPTIDPSNWKIFEFTGAPAGQYYIAINGSQVDVRMFYGGQVPSLPKMVVTEPTSLDFGLFDKEATPAPTKTFTISNTGKATLNGISVSSANAAFTITNAPSSLEAGASQEVTITMATDAIGAQSSLITVSATDMENVSFTVTGVVMPEDATVVDFNDNQLPAGWGNNASNKWSFADGKAYCTSAAELTTPLLEVTDGDFIIIKATSYDDYDSNYLEITGSADGSTWTQFEAKKFVSRAQIPYGSYAALVVSDIPSTVKYLKFKGYYVRIDEIIGLKFSNDAPILGYYTDLECATPATATVTKDFGFTTEAPDAQVYYIKNDGTGTMSIALGDVPAGFTAVLANNSLAEGESTSLTINMSVETKGYRNGNIVVNATNSKEEVIGTFTVNASGVVMEEGKLNLNFATDMIPSTWKATDWSKNANGYYRGGYGSTTMETSKLTATDNEEIVIVAKQDYNSGSFTVNYKKVDAEEWSTLIASTALGNSDWVTLHATIAEAGEYLLQIQGNYYTQIQRIYGLTPVAVPFMETTAPASIAFGMQTEESAEHSFTISNTGDATLTGLSVTLAKNGEEAEYAVRMTDSEDDTFTGTTLEVGATLTIHVKQLFDINKLGSKSDVLTIAADGQASVKVSLNGTTRDPSKLYVDFDNPNTFPEGWQVGANWNVYTYGSDRYAYQSSSSTPTALVTTPLNVADSEAMTFKVARYNSGYGYKTSLKTRYSQDGGATWSEYTEMYNNDEASSVYVTKTIEGIPAGNIIIEFFGNNIKLDMMEGFTLATAPALALTENGAAVVNGSTKAFGNLKNDGVATYTLKNIGNATMKATVKGENVTINDSESDYEVQLSAGESTELTVRMAFKAPYGEKNGKMTIETEDTWIGNVEVNYTATLTDPTNFMEDFSDNEKPLGWYQDGWSFTNGYASVNAGTNKQLITEMFAAEAETSRNVLTFKAKMYYDYETGDKTLNVYTSIDRSNWTLAKECTLTNADEFQVFSLDALADGNYYVKFEAFNACIDELSGVKKLETPEHDLYLTAASIPATTIKGNDATISATVMNLIADPDEKGVYAKLFINGVEEQTSEAQDITLNGTKTFAFTYAIPENTTAQIKVFNSNNEEVLATDTEEMKVNYIFDESADPETVSAGTFDVTLKRTFNAGWNTICVPFAIDNIETTFGEETKVYEFTDYNDLTLSFSKVDAIEAGIPYIIYVKQAITTPIAFTNKTVSNADAAVVTKSTCSFKGTYAPIAAPEMEGMWGITADGNIAESSSTDFTNGFRAYFDGNLSEARIAIFDEAIPTGVRYPGISEVIGTNDAIYNMNGQRVVNMKKGNLYIHNGKKTFRK